MLPDLDSKNLNVVITGATGLLGSHLACFLKGKGYTVTCLEHNSPRDLFGKIASLYSFSSKDFIWHTADILDTDSLLNAFVGADAVFHCAALVSYKPKDTRRVMEINAEGTRNCCNACLKAKVPALIFASSIAALGRKAGENRITENEEWTDSAYNSAYGISKHLAELELYRAAEEGLSIGIVNPGVILGAGDGHTSSNTIFHLLSKGTIIYPIGRNGFVGVKDVCNAMWMILDQKKFNKRYLMVSENWYFKDVLQFAADCMHVRRPRIALKGVLLKSAIMAAKFCAFFRLPFPFPAQGLLSTSTDSCYFPQNISDLSGFVFTPISEVIEMTIQELKTTGQQY